HRYLLCFPTRRSSDLHDTIGALPNRHLADVTYAQIALALAGGRDCHATNILGAAGCDKTEITAHFLIQVLLNDAHAGRRRELEGDRKSTRLNSSHLGI